MIDARARIDDLTRRIVRGEPDADRELGEWLVQSGGPILEPSRDGAVRATFIAEAADAKTVSLAGGITSWDPSRAPLSRLGDSDWWHCSLELREDLAATYQFWMDPPSALIDWDDLAEDEVAPLCQTWKNALRADPYNPRCLAPALGSIEDPHEVWESVLVLPGAPNQEWVAPPGAPAGRLERHDLQHTVLGPSRSRAVWVYTPAGAENLGPRPVLLCFDGVECREHLGLPSLVDRLCQEGTIDPPLVVFVDATSVGTRNLELGGNNAFVDHVAREVLPEIQRHHRLRPEPSLRIVAGFSYGGLSASLTAMRHPEAFGAVISLSGALYWAPADDPEPSWVVRHGTTLGAGLRWHLEVGALESHPSRWGPSTGQATASLAAELRRRQAEITTHEYVGGHENLHWRPGFERGLRSLLAVSP